MIRSKTVVATPPGATIKEQLVVYGMSQKEFAIRMGMSETHISRLINGKAQLTSDIAMRLEMVLGLPALFWSNLESIYREKLLKVQAENEMDADAVDAVEVVRCRDCKHFLLEQKVCFYSCLGELYISDRELDDFCSHGERREREEIKNENRE